MLCLLVPITVTGLYMCVDFGLTGPMERTVWKCLKTWRRSECLNIEGKGGCRKLHTEELLNLHSLSVLCKLNMSRRAGLEAMGNGREIQAEF